MTLTTLIVANAMLAGTVVLGMLVLLGTAIRADRGSVVTNTVSFEPSEHRDADRLAA